MTLRFRKRWADADVWLSQPPGYSIDQRKPGGRFALFIPGIEARSLAMYFDTLKEAKEAAELVAKWKVAK